MKKFLTSLAWGIVIIHTVHAGRFEVVEQNIPTISAINVKKFNYGISLLNKKIEGHIAHARDFLNQAEHYFSTPKYLCELRDKDEETDEGPILKILQINIGHLYQDIAREYIQAQECMRQIASRYDNIKDPYKASYKYLEANRFNNEAQIWAGKAAMVYEVTDNLLDLSQINTIIHDLKIISGTLIRLKYRQDVLATIPTKKHTIFDLSDDPS